MQTILVTGSNGFVGSCLVKHLLAKNYSVVATSRSESRLFRPYLQLPFKALDFTKTEQVENVLRGFAPAVIVHCGAMASPDQCEQDKEAAYLANVTGTANLLQAAAKYKSHFIYLSTDFVFGGEKGIYGENDERRPVNYYGVTKCQAEDLVAQYAHNWIIARTVMVYGKATSGKENFVTQTVARLKEGHRPTIFTDQERTFTFVEDLAKGIEAIIEKKATGIYHLAGPDAYTLYDAAVAAADYLQLDKSLIIPVQENDIHLPAVRPKKGGLCVDKAKTELGYRPLSFIEGLKATFGTNVQK